MSLVNVDNLKRYLDLGYNVLLEGHAGIGKTAMITEAFGGLKFKYFSAATLDPWVDFIGVPRPVRDINGGGDVLDIVPPKWVKDDDVEAIFLDELNRAPDKVLNAVMELIQFKSINGRKFKNLRVIWAAINPSDDDGEYATNRLDRALRDRFQVQIIVPYKIDAEYFKKKFPEIADAMITWWNDLPEAVRKDVSPRRCEYVADAYQNGCPLSDFLPATANVQKLMKAFKAQPFEEQLLEIQTEKAAKEFLANINNGTQLLKLINSKSKIALAFYNRFSALMPAELVAAMAPQVQAANTGASITTLEQLIPTLTFGKSTDKQADPNVTAAINKVVFGYTNGQTLSDEVQRLVSTNSKGFQKLSTHIYKVMTAAPEAVLRNAMFKPGTKEKSNLTMIALYAAQHDKKFEVFTQDDRKKINAHTYLHDCAASKWM